MKQNEARYDSRFANFISSQLGLSEDVKYQFDVDMNDLIVDLVIDNEGIRYFIEFKKMANFDTIARLNLYKDYFKDLQNTMEFVLATKSISSRFEEMAKALGILVVVLPRDIELPGKDIRKTTHQVKVTSEKSWRIICNLIRGKSISIRQSAIEEEVSYGWAHAIVEFLESQGIVERMGNRVSIVDIDKLLNGIAWERPTRSIMVTEYYTNYNNIPEALNEISRLIEKNNIKAVFASYIAGMKYTGYSARFDTVQLYCNINDARLLESILHDENNQGIKVQIFNPDRDVFIHERIIDNVHITSPCLTLLDLAGLGYKGKDLTKAMVERYANL